MNLDGLLFFPITPFDRTGRIDEAALESHIRDRVEAGAGAVFAACGTGEANALSPSEVLTVTAVAARAAAGAVPVFVGVGGTVATAEQLAADVRAAGADGILVLPPYLVSSPQDGLVAYVQRIVEASGLPAIVYQRGTMVFTPESAVRVAGIPGVIGLKDGTGDVSALQAIQSHLRVAGYTDFLYFNGLPTAELSMRAYRGIGITRYSSAVFAFAPDIAMAFFEALRDGDETTTELLLDRFYIPFVQLRDRGVGYQVSLVKSAVTTDGRSLAGVRSPLTEPRPEHVQELTRLVESARTAILDSTARIH